MSTFNKDLIVILKRDGNSKFKMISIINIFNVVKVYPKHKSPYI